MKKLAILTLLSTPAFANQIPFNDKAFLKLSGGDPKAAQEFSIYCSAQKSKADCIKSLAGSGNLKAEAARQCVQKEAATATSFILPNGAIVPITQAHQVTGNIWHEDHRTDADGEHRHVWTKKDREDAGLEAEARQIALEIQRAIGLNGTVTKTEDSNWNGNIQFGTGAVSPINVQISVGAGGGDGKEKALALLSPEARERVKAKKEEAEKNPNKTSVKPSITCFKHEKYCVTGDGSKVVNDQYEPEKKDEKKDDKKGAENSPKHEDESVVDIPDLDPTTGGDVWAGNDTNTPGTAIATPDIDATEKLSPMQRCVQIETKRLRDEFGKTTIDPNSQDLEAEEKKRADSLLKHGYCDEQVMGKEFCDKKKFQEESVVAVDIQEGRKEAASQALATFRKTGKCDPHALGLEFCKKEGAKWLRTPKETEIGTSESKLPVPRKPIKPGELPTPKDRF